jgi:hypothetical protein
VSSAITCQSAWETHCCLFSTHQPILCANDEAFPYGPLSKRLQYLFVASAFVASLQLRVHQHVRVTNPCTRLREERRNPAYPVTVGPTHPRADEFEAGTLSRCGGVTSQYPVGLQKLDRDKALAWTAHTQGLCRIRVPPRCVACIHVICMHSFACIHSRSTLYAHAFVLTFSSVSASRTNFGRSSPRVCAQETSRRGGRQCAALALDGRFRQRWRAPTAPGPCHHYTQQGEAEARLRPRAQGECARPSTAELALPRTYHGPSDDTSTRALNARAHCASTMREHNARAQCASTRDHRHAGTTARQHVSTSARVLRTLPRPAL